MISVILPNYHKKENIKKLIPTIRETLNGHEHEIIIIDDNGADDKYKVVEVLSENYPVRILKRNEKFDLNNTILSKFQHAKENTIELIHAAIPSGAGIQDSMFDLRIVIPAKDEEASIGTVIERTKEACPNAEIVVVDDGSRDRTADIARQKGVIVISNPTNYGYGKALKIGFMYNSGRPINYLGFLDADNTYPPEDISELYNLCKKNDIDIAVGSRFEGRNEGMPLIRKLGNKMFAFIVSLYTGKKVTDAGSGLRVFKASILPEFESLPDQLNYTPGMTAMALHTGMSYREIPIEYKEREGMSKLNPMKDGYRFLMVIMNSVRNHKPIAYFGTVGFPIFIVGVVLGIYSLFKFLMLKEFFIPTFVLTTLLVLTGLLIIMFGLMADMIVDLRRVVERVERSRGN